MKKKILVSLFSIALLLVSYYGAKSLLCDPMKDEVAEDVVKEEDFMFKKVFELFLSQEADSMVLGNTVLINNESDSLS